MKTLLTVLTAMTVLCFAGNAAATPLSASEKADFVSSGVPACVASGEKAQVKTVNWPVYCNCIMGKMSDDITKEDVMAIWVASEASRHSVRSAISSNWLRTHESTVRACLKSSI
jgi:hypothetical protein